MIDIVNLDISVLYVEDDDITREETIKYLKYYIKRLDYAKNGKEGLDLFLEKKHDLIITDIKMPIMNGLDMAHKIKEIKSNTPIIITSAYNDADLIIECIELGINQFVLKPVIISNMMESILKCVNIIEQY